MESGATLGAGASRIRVGDGPGGSSPRRRRVRLLVGIAVLAGLGAAIAGGVLLGASLRSSRGVAIAATPHRGGLDGEATWVAEARPAPAITTLRDQNGQLFSLASLHGRPVAMVFFDSFCKQECPLEGHALAAAERQIPAAQRPVLVVVSVDPADTRASVRHAIHSWGLAGVSPWYWLMGTHKMLAPVWRAYHIYVGPKIDGDIAHTEAVYFIDRKGYERSAYLYPFAQRFATHDMRRLAAESD